MRRVTQVNRGKNTPGVDKLVVKTPRARGKLVDEVSGHQPWRVRPTRRVYIPKANGKLRPLGIPTILDRAVQAVVKNALEPEWEARFEGCSYGFRPGRGCHDAIGKIYGLARPNKRKKWVLDADIRGAFDNIGHEALLRAIDRFPARELVKQWLKAGHVEDGRRFPAQAGTPQGGVASPLLANIAFHGMESALGVEHGASGQIVGRRALVRYADDFVVFCESEADAEAAKADLTVWLAERGLALSEEKTRIRHLAEGFDFLGFNVRHYPAPKTSRSGWKLLIKPSKDAVKRHRARLKAEWRSLNGHKASKVVERLNPIVRGWANYYRVGVSKEVFGGMDRWMFERCVRYAKRTHPGKSWAWCANRYRGRLRKGSADRWVFGDKSRPGGRYLRKHSWTPVRRHALVKGCASPDDPALAGYWAGRAAKRSDGLSGKEAALARRQKGLCPACGDPLLNGEELHKHHHVARKRGGGDETENLRLVHLFCHQQIHAQERRGASRTA